MNEYEREEVPVKIKPDQMEGEDSDTLQEQVSKENQEGPGEQELPTGSSRTMSYALP